MGLSFCQTQIYVEFLLLDGTAEALVPWPKTLTPAGLIPARVPTWRAFDVA